MDVGKSCVRFRKLRTQRDRLLDGFKRHCQASRCFLVTQILSLEVQIMGRSDDGRYGGLGNLRRLAEDVFRRRKLLGDRRHGDPCSADHQGCIQSSTAP